MAFPSQLRGPSLNRPLLALAFALAGGCATGKATAPDPAASGAALERLRAENAAQVRRMEELENQVFVLTSELDARRGGGPAAAAVAPPALPELKLAPADKVSARANDSAGNDAPESLVDETEVEYAGAAAERGTARRPVLRLSGTDADDGARVELAEAEGEAPRARGSRRMALARRPPRPEVELPRPAKPAVPVTAAAATSATDLYQSALVHLRAGRHEDAATGFRAFVAAHPQHDLADNAQYWLGECYYDRKDYSTALREFRRVAADFPSGNKVPDALLKLGLAYLALGSDKPGRETLADLARRFPQHPATALAEAKLAELGPRAALAPKGSP
jgi:tol-pal system protein YbgF